MSKKHKAIGVSAVRPSQDSAHVAEYQVIRHDLIKVILLNVVYLALVLGLYLSNQQSRFLERWLGSMISL